MRILHINASYKPAFIYGGPTMSVAMLCEQLVRAGITIEVFTTTANGQNELPVIAGEPVQVDNVPVTYFNRLTKDHTHFSPSLLSALWRQVKKYDVIHIHAWWNTVSVLSALIAVTRKVPVVISPRGMLSPYSFSNRNAGVKSALHNLLGKRLLRKSDIHVTSEREKQAVLNIIPPKKINTIANLVKLPAYIKAIKTAPGLVLKLIFLSRIEEKKGLDILLNALPLLSVNYHLTIAGTGDGKYIEHLKKITSDNHLIEKINWVGFSDENKFELLKEHDLFILPSHDENFGNVVIESLSVGTAVLISPYVGLADYVVNNKLGWLADTDAIAVANAINDIGHRRTDELKRIGEQAPLIIYNDFDPDNLVQQYVAMYNDIIKHERL